jgi:Concanavalin A-like lectin/glucanases superfamily
VTYSGDSANLYRNGALVASASGTYVAGNTTMGIDTGTGGVDFYWGSVDDTRMYNSALSSAAILALYQSAH